MCMNGKYIQELVDIQGYLGKGEWLELGEVRLHYSPLRGFLLYVRKESPRDYPTLGKALTAFLKECGALKLLSEQEEKGSPSADEHQ